MRRLYLSILLIALLCLAGCRGQLEQEYSSIVPHEDPYDDDLYADALTAENYLSLKNAIMSYITAGDDYGVVRVYSYDGNLTSDLANAVYDLCHNDPYGAYAVEHMMYDYAHIVSYYELYFYITFRDNLTDQADFYHCSNSTEVESQLEDILLKRQYRATIRISNYQSFDLPSVMHRIFLSHPELGIGEPTFSYALYPDSGVQRILDLRITYQYDAFYMYSISSYLADTVDQMTETLARYSDSRTQVEQIYQWIQENVTYINQESGLFSAAYNTLCKKYSNCEGITLSVQLLCDKLGIPCFIVEGERKDTPWFWNIIYYDGIWHHLDATQDLLDDCTELQERYDEDMQDYSWQADQYPACPMPSKESPAFPDSSRALIWSEG